MNKFSIFFQFFISFLQKLHLVNVNYSTDFHVACDSFTWIDGVTYTSSNNTALYTFVGGNAAGCDSIVTLNLEIKVSSAHASNVLSSDSIIVKIMLYF